MRKNGVARTFEPLGECAVLASGFTREKPAFSRLAPPGAVYCRPPAESAYITGGNLQKPYFHALSETAAKKDKAKAVLFLNGEEKPFSAKEKETCEKYLKELFCDLKIGKNELAIFTNDSSPSQTISRRYKISVGGYPCEIDFLLRVSAGGFTGEKTFGGENTEVSYHQLLILTDARISSPMLLKMLKSLYADPLGCTGDSADGGLFDAAAFLSGSGAENYPIDRADAEYGKAFRLIRSALTDFLAFAAESCGEKLITAEVRGAKSAREAVGAATSFARRNSVAESLKRGWLNPYAVLEAIGAAGFASAETANVYLTSETGKICVVYEGKPLFPATEAQRTVLKCGNAKILAELGAGNYSASACIFIRQETEQNQVNI